MANIDGIHVYMMTSNMFSICCEVEKGTCVYQNIIIFVYRYNPLPLSIKMPSMLFT